MMNRHRYIVVALLIFTIVGVSCTFTEKIRDGRTAFERKRYFQASEMLMSEFEVSRSNLDRMNIAYLIGESNMKFGAFEEAARWYKIAYEGGYGPSALSAYANGLKQLERYEDAASSFAKVGDEIGDRVKYRREIANCLQAVEWRNDAIYTPYVIENLKLNSNASDYAPVPVSTNEIAFTSDREMSTGEYIYAWSGNDFSDLFIADLRQNSVKQYGGEQINIDGNEGTVAFSPDGTKMVFCRCFSREDYDAHCKLMISEKNDLAWSKPVILPFIKDGINYRHPTFSQDGTMLVFSANIDEATNDYDLYLSRFVDNNWEQPQSLGVRVNSQRREGFPFLHGDTLYFSSDFAGMGDWMFIKHSFNLMVNGPFL
ncbi:MAG: tetratricopeptide repeat protein [Saprospiraceae bacterium]|nr:tetratricopeptide repeat protein [Saprospiraceae bacterium]